MAVKLIEREYTTRTNPRLMKSTTSGDIAMTLHDHVEGGGIIWLNGPNAGRTVRGAVVAWENFDDLVGSVTLHNAD